MIDKGLSERRSLAIVGMSASAYRYQTQPDRNEALRQRIVALAQRHKRYGVGMIHLKLRQEGELVNYKRVERLYQEERLQVRRRKRKKVPVGNGPRLNLLRIEEELSAAHLRLSNVIVENVPWHDCVQRYDRPATLFYLDPPYWETEGYGVDFPFSEYERMADLMRTVKGKVLVSINDHPAIREVFAGFTMIPLQIRYSIGREGREKPAGELIIKSWDDSQAQLL